MKLSSIMPARPGKAKEKSPLSNLHPLAGVSTSFRQAPLRKKKILFRTSRNTYRSG
ncbi:hypothetical protein [Methanosarcina siciliae]|uniref:hypothetical protein n=1 Tax=Methanosarcina siciliae TaxID=38027 RepID=UPI0012E09202|nr:hypothetical protein [Methanosarcina siciliae]